MPARMEKRFTDILNAMEDGIYIIGQDLVLEFMNNTMIKDFGEGIGDKCYHVINRLDAVCPWCRAEEVFQGETLQWEHHMPKLDKTCILLEHPLKNTDGSFSKISICRDITQRKRREAKKKPIGFDSGSLHEVDPQSQSA